MADLTLTDVVSNTSQNPPKVPATSTEHQVLKLSSTQCEQVCEQICKMGYKVVALQIPRSMLQYSKSIIAQLREKLQTSEQNAEQPQERSFQVKQSKTTKVSLLYLCYLIVEIPPHLYRYCH